jgi:hypothetical protein
LEGVVLEDVALSTDRRTGRWLFAEVMVWAVLCDVSENDRQWRLADLGFGFVLHAGDSIDDVGFNGSGAAVRYNTMVGMDTTTNRIGQRQRVPSEIAQKLLTLVTRQDLRASESPFGNRRIRKGSRSYVLGWTA